MSNVKYSRRERGVVLVLVLLLIVSGTVIALAAMTSSNIEMMISANQRTQEQLFDAAEAGIDQGIKAFFADAPPWGAVRPPITDPPKTRPWGVPQNLELRNGYQYTLVVTDMEVSKRPPPGHDPSKYRTFYYRIASSGREQNTGSGIPRGVRETEQVIGVVYKIK